MVLLAMTSQVGIIELGAIKSTQRICSLVKVGRIDGAC